MKQKCCSHIFCLGFAFATTAYAFVNVSKNVYNDIIIVDNTALKLPKRRNDKQ